MDLANRRALDSLRRDIPGLDQSCYFNTGTLGPSPRPVTERFFELYRAWLEAGPGSPAVYQAAAQAAQAVKTDIAAFLGVEADEMALTANATDGINVVANGIQWRAGDEVIISDQEHPAGLLIWLHLRQTRGVRVRIAKLSSESRPKNIEEVAGLITPRTRLVALSHVSSMTGLCLPAREIAEAAHARDVPVLFDGAQSAGQFPLDIGGIGCDFYCVTGHKWLLGPIGTGAVYVSRRALLDLVPDRVGAGSEERYTYAEDGPLVLAPTARRFEFATRCWPLWQAWPEALAFLGRVGLDSIRAREIELSQRLRRGLAALRGVQVTGPAADGDPELLTGLVSCRVGSMPGQALYEALLTRFNVVTRPVVEHEAARFSVAFFNTEDEVERAVGAVAALAA